MALSIRPRRVSARSHLRWWLDSGRMRSLIGGVCINQASPQSKEPTIRKSEARCHAPVSRPEGTASAQGLQLSLYPQTQETCDDYDHDHHTDDVKDIHCVLLRVRDANPLEGWQIGDWVHPGSFCHGCQSVVGANHAFVDQRKSVSNCSSAIFRELSFVCFADLANWHDRPHIRLAPTNQTH